MTKKINTGLLARDEKSYFIHKILELQAAKNLQKTDFSPIIISGEKSTGYRNKMEYPFYAFEDEKLSLAEYIKGSRRGLMPFEGSPLAAPAINECALSILKVLNELGIKKRQLKGLQMRYSWYENKVTALLFVKDENFIKLPPIAEINEKTKCLLTYYSTPKSPAYVMTKKIASEGEEVMREKVLDKVFEFPFDGFFQVNNEMFETVLNEIKAYLHSYSQLALHKKLSSLIDLYCGVGTIGVSLSEHFDRIVGVELTQSAQYFAQENAKSNSVQNFTFYSGATEKQILGLITEEDVLVIDPPRAGCHKNVISEILNCVPKLIIYLSCNPETQLRDIELLVSKYDIDLVKTYDFFPNTDHLENLVILKKNP